MSASREYRRLMRERKARKIKINTQDMWDLADEIRSRSQRRSLENAIAEMAETLAILLEKKHGR